MSTRSEEVVGPHYDRTQMLEARRRTFEAIARIAAAVKPGVRESAATALAKSILKELGLLRGWHGVYVRLGSNTLCTYNDKDAPDVMLAENDIFYIDIGPVWEKWEGDGGDTFVVGNDPEMQRAATDVKRIFDRVHEKWRTDGATGAELYLFAEGVAQSMGWKLNLDVAGHRLADFPHAALHSGTLAAIPFAPAADMWVLEIQIRHPEKRFGAFFEDLLFRTEPGQA